jgi:cell division protein FtsQ
MRGNGEPCGVAARKRATATAAVQPLQPSSPLIRRLVLSGRSAAVGLALLVLAGAAYAAARETSIFAVTRLEIVGGTPRVQEEVRAALAGEVGRSLLEVNGDEIDRRIATAPDVMSVSFDRAFPNTLRVVVRPERPVLLLRRGNQGWVVSARGRVLREVRNTRRSSLPRVWVPRTTEVSVNTILVPESGGMAAAALAPLSPRLFGKVEFVRANAEELTLILRTGLEIRFGDLREVRLKVAIAREILGAIGPSTTSRYMDVSVPERPVVGAL